MSTTTTTAGPDERRVLGGVLADVGLPVGTYYGLHALGAPDPIALLAATGAAGLRLLVVAVRSRRVSGSAAVLFGVYAVGLALSVVSGDPRLMLVKDSVGPAVVGVGCLVSLLGARPLLLTAMEGVRPALAAETTRRYRECPAVRRTVRALTTMWGVGLLADAALRIPVVYALPISVGVAVSQAMTVVVATGLGAVTVRWARTVR